jgi:hypothetical protein
MPITSASDITLVLSGGSVNINPDNSLGGDPSSSPITSALLNNLFSDVTADQSSDGYEDHRCIYVFNDGDTTVYNVQLWIAEDFNEGDGSVEIGVYSQDESQRITVTGDANGGSFTLSYKSEDFTVNFDADLAVWATNLQTAINDLTNDDDEPFFHNAVVVASNAGASVVFDINFSALDAKRNFDKFVLASNDLTSDEEVTMLITTPREGSPINTIASEINAATTPPGNVGFFAPTSQSPITLPYLASGEGFPLWVRRTIPAGTVAQENDGFILSIRAESLL